MRAVFRYYTNACSLDSSSGLGHRPLTAVTGVRLPYRVPCLANRRGFLLGFARRILWDAALFFFWKPCGIIAFFKQNRYTEGVGSAA